MIVGDPILILMDVISTMINLDIIPESVNLLSSFNIDLMDDFSSKYIKSHKVAFVGLNPSEESPDNSAFHPETRSGKAVRSWLNNDENYVVKFTNITHHKNSSSDKPINAALKMPAIINTFLEYDYKIITCGTVADTILKKNGIKHFAMPHPSGLNRFWNDKKAGEAKIKEMLEWIKLN